MSYNHHKFSFFWLRQILATLPVIATAVSFVNGDILRHLS